MASSNDTKKSGRDYMDEVKKNVEDIKFGSLTLVIQDGKVIQLDRIEKIRL
ncbi:MAG: YezD family protein [Lachnospira sp.]|nr:YezD family protein [Lachnospira sp.]